ncbi:response regulator [Dietzia sp. UCD-THP]|uniref:response regulator transcription factor n=1 Tax=Dietzia sp. UCD-THP TaxID=1292020 RepID=UPI0003657CDB|nr:response regulator [Dietzia sp. UCD-THP]
MTGEGQGSRAIRTLIVDDDPVARRLHSRYVEGVAGFSVAAAVGDGQAAVGWVAGGGIDLVLLDIGLPGFSGIEVLHRIRTISRRPISVIVVSSLRDRITVRQALSGQVAGYLVKPFTRAAMVDRLERFRSEFGAGPPAELDSFGQGEIDALLRRGAGTGPSAPAGSGTAPAGSGPAGPATASGNRAPERLPKGLSEPTLNAVLAALDDGAGHSAAEVARASGASRATVRRYLDHLHRNGAVDVSHRYGGRGRPELLYRIVVS